jgi:hypothetical protein
MEKLMIIHHVQKRNQLIFVPCEKNAGSGKKQKPIPTTKKVK